LTLASEVAYNLGIRTAESSGREFTRRCICEAFVIRSSAAAPIETLSAAGTPEEFPEHFKE
jgi:hypothetical protein